MELCRPVDEWRKTIEPALESKVQEFKLMGYEQATNDTIWNCLKDKVWKGSPEKRLHEVVQDIFHLGTNIFMSYLTISVYTEDTDLMSSIEALTEKKS